ncbi:hypothetical protein ACMXYX_13040 [Neptuniibacter sp. QD72_48]|uniref:hypothetical protein n=1 Tax=unclassified Neptuniibacter TaxID=2630693 RepID=UPI0039F5507F
MSEIPETLSTSALAKALKKTTKQMFAELETLGWIERHEDAWKLTAKGEFEGGKYRESQKFGRYIIWPREVTEHKALSSPDAGLLSVTQLSRHFSLSRSVMEQVLHEMAWIRANKKGWQVTSLGEKNGAYQRENASTGVPYVLWSDAVLDHEVLIEWIEEVKVGLNSQELICCDGHLVANEAERLIDNWLYLSGLAHAYKRRLPLTERIFADFYLPQYHLYIEYWGDQVTARELSAKMRKKELLKANNCACIEIQDEDLLQLDEALTRKLLKHNIEI